MELIRNNNIPLLKDFKQKRIIIQKQLIEANDSWS